MMPNEKRRQQERDLLLPALFVTAVTY